MPEKYDKDVIYTLSIIVQETKLSKDFRHKYNITFTEYKTFAQLVIIHLKGKNKTYLVRNMTTVYKHIFMKHITKLEQNKLIELSNNNRDFFIHPDIIIEVLSLYTIDNITTKLKYL